MASKRPQTNGHAARAALKVADVETLAPTATMSPGAGGLRRLVDPALFSDPYAAANFIGSVLEASTETSMIGMDLEGNIQLWNEGARRLYGYEPEEVIGKANSSALHAPADVAAGVPIRMMATALDTGKFEGDVVRRRKDGTTFTARAVLTPRRDHKGDAIGFLLISRDVSDEIRLSQALEATQVYTRSLMESNVDAIMTTDPLGVITDVNQQMESLAGLSREELIGSRFNRYFTEPQKADEGIRLVLREGKVTNYELTARSKTGRETLVSYNAAAFFDRDNKLQGVFAAARDITEQKKLEEQLREQQNYLRGLIESSVDGLLTVDPQGLISDLTEQMCRLSGYTREDLLGLVAGVVRNVISTMELLASKKSIRLDTDVAAAGTVPADLGKLKQMLLNLVSNAVKFTPEGGRVTVVAKRFSETVEISVTDTGIGIAESDQDEIFKAFRQIDSATAREQHGTGLGLALVKRFIELHGGQIRISSELGTGSVFTLALPLAPSGAFAPFLPIAS